MSAGTFHHAPALAQLAKSLTDPAAQEDDITLYFHRAQQRAELVVENVEGTSGTAIPVRIELPATSLNRSGRPPGPSFILFRGLPDAISLSKGFRMKSSWAVSVKDTDDLELLSPPDYRGIHVVEAILQTGEAAAPIARQFSISL